MKLSVVIVNYNVCYFLEQCLHSVARACKNVEAEVFVVDNASADGSVEMVRSKFPDVKVIANTDNKGFSKANNQAIEVSTGEYVLLLNPDTVIAEDTFEKCVAFMDAHADAGGLGVHMVDGKGVFLPESKRGLPTPFVAFCKTFGLSAFFPKSKTFGRYHLGFLSEKETHEVDVLSGAYMLLRKTVLDKIGLLDETFFMYGEDVDLSYRVQLGGYKNYYYPDTTIIHYKGESTKKGSLNYVKVFYNAMLIFARKHFSGNQSGLFSLLINVAIVFRGALTLFSSLIASSYLFIIDALLSFAGIYVIKTYWENMIKYSENYYPNQFLFIVVPTYILLWIIAAFFSGAYDKPFRVGRILRGVFAGTIAIAVLYAFIPNEWRFSRAIILLGAAWTAAEMILTRALYHLARYQSFTVQSPTDTVSLIVGKPTEAERAEKNLRNLGSTAEIVHHNDIHSLAKAAAIYKAGEVVFCSADYLYADIIAQMQKSHSKIDYKILNTGSEALIGSNSKDTAGDLYVAERNYKLFLPENRRAKRALEIVWSLLLIPVMPFFLSSNFGGFIQNWIEVLTSKKRWVGFTTQANFKRFPKSVPGVVSPAKAVSGFALNEEETEAAELHYARHYSAWDDVTLLVRNFKNLDK